MFVHLTRVTPATFETIKKDPDLLDAILEGDEKTLKKLGMTEEDSEGFDYISAQEMLEAKSDMDADVDEDEDEDDDEDEVDEDDDDEDEVDEDDDDEDEVDEDDDDEDEDGLDEDDLVFKDLGADGTLDFDGGYGKAQSLSPAAVKKALKDAAVLELDEDVKALFKAAAKRGDYIIAMVT
jgi:hypothetical protein